MRCGPAPHLGARLGGTLLVLLLGAGLWLALAGWTVRQSERFYLLVPPLAAAQAVVWLWPDRPRLRKLALSALRGTLIGGFLCFAYLLYLGYLMTGGRSASMPVRGWEVICGAWFLLAVGILFLAGSQAIEFALQAAARRWCAADPQTTVARAWRFTLEKTAPRVLVLALVFAWMLGVFNVHRPKLGLLTDPRRSLQLDYEDISFVTDDQHVIRGWFIPAADPNCQRTVIICHGLGANRSPFVALAGLVHQHNAHSLMFDFRGHGESDGHTVSFGWHERADVLAAVAYLRTQRPEQCRKLYGLGVSMGTSALVRAAAEVEPPLDGIILDSAFTSADDMAEQVIWVIPWPVRPALVSIALPIASLEASAPLTKVRPVDQAENIRCPLLVVHATGDPTIPATQGRQVYDRARQPKKLLLVESPHHTGALTAAPGEYAAAVRWVLGDSE